MLLLVDPLGVVVPVPDAVVEEPLVPEPPEPESLEPEPLELEPNDEPLPVDPNEPVELGELLENPPYEVSWSPPIPSRSRPNDCQAQ